MKWGSELTKIGTSKAGKEGYAGTGGSAEGSVGKNREDVNHSLHICNTPLSKA